ncbi:MAG: nucleotide-binding protein [Thaumarchaeota archaeon]|nr:nucleotide-binding protein [Nitrososphaerota archaeon]
MKRTLQVAESIEKNNAGKPYDRLTLAGSINYSPNSSGFRQIIISSGRYGLTEGGVYADKIGLSSLGSSIVAPTTDEQRGQGLREALLKPDLFRRVYEFYDKKQIPREELFKNALRKEFGVSPDDIDPCYNVITTNMKDYNLIQNIRGNDFLQLSRLAEASIATLPQPTLETASGTDDELGEEHEAPQQPPPATSQIPKQIFVAHGKNTRPLEQLEKILNRFKVSYKVAEEEANRGRPVGQKVAELMQSCTSGIFIFTADEETTDAQGNKVFRPSDNVVYELGAASVLYGEKIVVLKENDVSFASDFKDLAYITFDKDKLDAKAADLMVEFIGLGFLELRPT